MLSVGENLKSFGTLECIIILPGVLLLSFISIMWDVYFAKRIIHFVKSYRECVEKSKTEFTVNYSEAARHHKSEIIKYTFLIVINVTEFITMLTYALGSGLAYQQRDFNRTTDFNCSSELANFPFISIEVIFANPVVPVLVSSGDVGFVISLAFSVCLMKYLDVILHNIHGKPFRYITKFLLITFFIGAFMIVTGSIPQLLIIEKLSVPIIDTIYFIIWIKCIRTFYNTLRWRAIEFKIRGERKSIVRKAIINCKQFALVMGILAIATACLILTEILSRYYFLIVTGLHYGPCIFQYLYRTPLYQPLLVSQQQIRVLKLIHEVIAYVSSILIFTASILIGSEYLLATILFFGIKIVKKLKYRFGCVHTRFTPTNNLRRPLLIPN